MATLGGRVAVVTTVLAGATLTYAWPRSKGPGRTGAQGHSRPFREASLYGTADARGSGRLKSQRLKVEMAIYRRCSIIIVVCPNVVARCGRCGTTSIVTPQIGRRQRRDFSGESSQTSLRACYRKLMIYPSLGNPCKPCSK